MAKKLKPRKKEWSMPAWMEPFRSSICNTGGNTVEELMNGNTDPVINLPVSTLECAVKSQVSLLYALSEKQILTTRPNQIPSDDEIARHHRRRSPEANV